MKIPLFALFFFMPLPLVSGRCQSDQQSCLLQLKKSLRFHELRSTKLATWDFKTDCCEWEGISCDLGGLGHVISLDLSYESISGGLDSSSCLFNVQSLQSLDLSFNNFNTTLPVQLSNLTDLRYLNLSDAGFVGQIPIQISNMTSLVSLDLSSAYTFGDRYLKLEDPNLATLVQNLSQVTDLRLDNVNISLPGNEWGQALALSLPNLEVMSLSSCFLSGPVDPCLAKLKFLSVINLSHNNLSDSVPGFFANFSKLTALQLYSCELLGRFPQTIFQLSSLEMLGLSYNDLLRVSFPEFHQDFSLQTLDLSFMNLSSTLPESIGNFGNLSRVDLVSCGLTGPIPNSVANLTRLVYLDLSLNTLTGPVPSFLMSKDLAYVDLSHNQLTGEIPSSHFEGLLKLMSVNLGYNKFQGSIPSSLFAIPSLQKVQLSNNQFWGQIPVFPNVSSSHLDVLELSSNRLEGPIPSSMFGLGKLNVLVLSSNKLNGTMQLDQIQKLPYLRHLDLSYNNLIVNASATNSTKSSFSKISTLRLASCNLKMFPILGNQSEMFHLDLSDNQITGIVPGWILCNSLQYLNLSFNLLVGLEKPFSLPSLAVLDLHRNQLQGNIPFPPTSAFYLDYSSNNFTSSIPPNIGNHLMFAFYFSLANNNITGKIPQSICNALNLQVLDLSNNSFNGAIPSCLIERLEDLHVLNLRRNNFDGNIPDKFPLNCELETLDLSGNNLQGQVPRSLTNCTKLEILDFGNNQINDIFPCPWKSISSLRILVLRSNKFFGRIGCPENNGTWPRLQILDLASNNFIGYLPEISLNNWKAMMEDGNGTGDQIRFSPLVFGELFYQDSLTVTMKGHELELVKIWSIFTSIDFSCNNFEGSIPEAIGHFKALYLLNLSHNAFSGHIPSYLGDLMKLESLDLSNNHLSGQIPQLLAMLTFLSFLNLSHNYLVGPIPIGSQFQTFSADSFQGNNGLCGLPLLACSNATCGFPLNDNCSHGYLHENGTNINWNFLSVELGYIFGLGIIILPLMLCTRWRVWYYKHVDRALFRIFPQLNRTSKNRGRRTQRNSRRL